MENRDSTEVLADLIGGYGNERQNNSDADRAVEGGRSR
jgi:hypothetical protein